MAGDKLTEGLYSESMDSRLKRKSEPRRKSRGHWGPIWNRYQTRYRADELLVHDENYPLILTHW